MSIMAVYYYYGGSNYCRFNENPANGARRFTVAARAEAPAVRGQAASLTGLWNNNRSALFTLDPCLRQRPGPPILLWFWTDEQPNHVSITMQGSLNTSVCLPHSLYRGTSTNFKRGGTLTRPTGPLTGFVYSSDVRLEFLQRWITWFLQESCGMDHVSRTKRAVCKKQVWEFKTKYCTWCHLSFEMYPHYI